MTTKYNPADVESIITYAKKLVKKSLRSFVDESKINEIGNSPNGKGGYGQIVEEFYFEYKPNSNNGPDFPEAGLELKTSPLKKLGSGNYAAKERLVLNIINYMDIVKENWESSLFLKKNSNLLLIFYAYQEEPIVFRDYIIELVDQWELPAHDLRIIKQDWNKIKSKVDAGLAHELSESDTFYLGACTKGANKGSVRQQPNSKIDAMQRAFCFKPTYVNQIINHFICNIEEEQETLINEEDNNILDTITFENYVMEKFDKYINKPLHEIVQDVGVEIKDKNKSSLAQLARRILGVKGNKIEEFEKAAVVMKVIRINQKGMPKEAISFPTFKYKEIINEDWDESTLLSTMDKKFFFVIFQEGIDGGLILKKTMFWNMPYNDLHTDVKNVFEETKRRILNGNTKNLPKSSENRVSHVRPHAKNKNDTYETPHGTFDTKKCFWLNTKYIAEQIK